MTQGGRSIGPNWGGEMRTTPGARRREHRARRRRSILLVSAVPLGIGFGGPEPDMVAELARLVELTMRRRRHSGAGTQHTPAHLAGAEQGRHSQGSPGRRLPLVALVLQWRQDYPNNRPPTRATAISAMGQQRTHLIASGRGDGRKHPDPCQMISSGLQ
jgi:hypothetical protein